MPGRRRHNKSLKRTPVRRCAGAGAPRGVRLALIPLGGTSRVRILRQHCPMRDKYYPPEFGTNKFHCIHCGVYASQSWHNVYVSVWNQSKDANIRICLCSHCGEWSYWYNEQMIIPASAPVEPPHPDLPPECRADFDEARSIFSQSPRAAAALLRLSIQKLLSLIHI